MCVMSGNGEYPNIIQGQYSMFAKHMNKKNMLNY